MLYRVRKRKAEHTFDQYNISITPSITIIHKNFKMNLIIFVEVKKKKKSQKEDHKSIRKCCITKSIRHFVRIKNNTYTASLNRKYFDTQ